MRMLTAGLALAVALVAGQVSMAAADVIRGSATYRERMALPSGTTLEVELLDVTKADAPAVVVASASIPVLRQPPIAFALDYDPAQIDEKNDYALTARLMSEGSTRFRSTATTPVLKQGVTETPEILLVRSDEPAEPGQTATEGESGADPEGGAATADTAAQVPGQMAEIAGTWIASEINGAATDDKVVSWLKLNDAGRAQGQGGCNSYSGTYKLEDGTLTFGALASTRRACPETQMSQEQRFFAALGAVKAARLESGDLLLTDLSGDPLLRLRKK